MAKLAKISQILVVCSKKFGKSEGLSEQEKCHILHGLSGVLQVFFENVDGAREYGPNGVLNMVYKPPPVGPAFGRFRAVICEIFGLLRDVIFTNSQLT